jgi:hypothetical protein
LRLGVYKKTDVQIGYISGDWQFPTDGVLSMALSFVALFSFAVSRFCVYAIVDF